VAERPHRGLIGSIQRESLDHLIVFDEAHLRRALKNYDSYYNQIRMHISLEKNAPDFSAPGNARRHRSDTNARPTPSSVRPGLGID
jgi:hypothetical protein